MSAVEVDIAEAIATALNAEEFSQSFAASMSYADIATALTETDELKVDVVPWKSESELADRGELEYTVETDIVIRKRFSVQDQVVTTQEINKDAINEMMQLRQEISEFFTPSQVTGQTGRSLSSQPNASWQSTKVMASFVRPHLRQFRQFTGWLRITYQICRAAGS